VRKHRTHLFSFRIRFSRLKLNSWRCKRISNNYQALRHTYYYDLYVQLLYLCIMIFAGGEFVDGPTCRWKWWEGRGEVHAYYILPVIWCGNRFATRDIYTNGFKVDGWPFKKWQWVYGIAREKKSITIAKEKGHDDSRWLD
jgi:hypothetical protein